MANRHIPLEHRHHMGRRRIAAGVNQPAFARMLGIRRELYCRYETGSLPCPKHIEERAERILLELEVAQFRIQRLQLAEAGVAGRVA